MSSFFPLNSAKEAFSLTFDMAKIEKKIVVAFYGCDQNIKEDGSTCFWKMRFFVRTAVDKFFTWTDVIVASVITELVQFFW